MPSIRMKKDTENRTAGKLYMVTQSDGWELVRTYKAEWEYVTEAVAKTLTEADEPKKYPMKPRPKGHNKEQEVSPGTEE